MQTVNSGPQACKVYKRKLRIRVCGIFPLLGGGPVLLELHQSRQDWKVIENITCSTDSNFLCVKRHGSITNNVINDTRKTGREGSWVLKSEAVWACHSFSNYMSTGTDLTIIHSWTQGLKRLMTSLWRLTD